MLTTLRTTHDTVDSLLLAFASLLMTGCAARRKRSGAVRWQSSIAYHCSSVIFWFTLSPGATGVVDEDVRALVFAHGGGADEAFGR
jgi:hypothetical protein